MIPLQFGNMFWGKMVWGRMLLVCVSVWRGEHPSTTLSPCQPSSSGTIPDSKHPVLSCYYNVHPVWSGHHLNLCLYQNSVLVLLGRGPNGIWQESTIPTASMPIHCQVPSPTLISHCILGILIFKDGEVYLHMCLFSMPPASSRMSRSI